MKKQLLILIALLGASSLFAQVALETLKFTNASLAGENGTIGTGTGTGIPNYDGVINHAIEFNGTQSINYGNLALDATNGISFSFWVKPTADLVGAYSVFGKRDICGNTNTVQGILNGTSKTVSLALRTASGLSMSASATYLENVWQKFTFTVSKQDGKIRVYRNGDYIRISASSITPASIPATFTGDFEVANGPCVNQDGTKKYEGGLDDLEVFNSTLTDVQISTAFAATNYDVSSFRAKLVDQSLLVHYPFDSSLANQVELYRLHIADKSGVEDQALNVQNDKVYSLGNPQINTANGVTFSFWIKPDVMSDGNIVFEKRSACTWDDLFAVNANGALKTLNLEIRSTAQKVSSVAVPYTPRVWQKITFTIDNTVGKLYSYIDGQPADSSNITAGSIPATFTTNSNLKIGDGVCVTTSAKRYDGGIDELYIYEETLSPSQIETAFNNDDDEQVNWVVKENFSDLLKFNHAEMELTDRFDPATSNVDRALVLDGATNFNLGTPTINSITGEGYTFSFWVNPDATVGVDQILFSRRNICNWTNMFAFRMNGGTNKFVAEFRTSAQKVKSISLDYVPGEWQQIAVTVDLSSKMIRGYFNGTKIDSATIVGNEFVTNYSSGSLNIASEPCGLTKYTGGLDELKIYSLALNDVEILGQFHNEVVTGIEAAEEKVALSIFPNPAFSAIYTEVGPLMIYNAVGHLVLSVDSQGEVDISNLETGIYLVSQNNKRTKLLVK